MEGDVQTPAPDQPESEARVARESDAAILAFLDDPPREREEMRMLLIGFATGLSIGAIFLIYVVLDAAHLLT